MREVKRKAKAGEIIKITGMDRPHVYDIGDIFEVDTAYDNCVDVSNHCYVILDCNYVVLEEEQEMPIEKEKFLKSECSTESTDTKTESDGNMKEVKRKAKAGDKIKIVNAAHTMGAYKNGDVLTVKSLATAEEGFELINTKFVAAYVEEFTTPYILSKEYVVLEEEIQGKDDLKNGDILFLRNGTEYIIINNRATSYRGYIGSISSNSLDLNNHDSRDTDIMKVIRDCEVIFERKEPIELEKEVGNAELIEIIDEGVKATGSSDNYSRGMCNGMLFVKACIDGNNPEYLEAPEELIPPCPCLGETVEKTPLGVAPCYIALTKRNDELNTAIERYIVSNVPNKLELIETWIKEIKLNMETIKKMGEE